MPPPRFYQRATDGRFGSRAGPHDGKATTPDGRPPAKARPVGIAGAAAALLAGGPGAAGGVNAYAAKANALEAAAGRSPGDAARRVRVGLAALPPSPADGVGHVKPPFPLAAGFDRTDADWFIPPEKFRSLTDAVIEAAPIVRVPKRLLYATQSGVSAAKVAELAGKDAGASLVVRMPDRKLYIVDGTHRATAAVLAGRALVPAKALAFDGSTFRPLSQSDVLP